MFHFFIMFNRQRKLRFERWFETPNCDKKVFLEGLVYEVLMRRSRLLSNILEYRGKKIIYRRYASLYFACGIDEGDNELIHLEIIHRYVELLDQYFGSVCELDVLYNFEKANFIFDELMLGGEMLESSKLEVIRATRVQDRLQERKHLLNSRYCPPLPIFFVTGDSTGLLGCADFERETKKSIFRNNRV